MLYFNSIRDFKIYVDLVSFYFAQLIVFQGDKSLLADSFRPSTRLNGPYRMNSGFYGLLKL